MWIWQFAKRWQNSLKYGQKITKPHKVLQKDKKKHVTGFTFVHFCRQIHKLTKIGCWGVFGCIDYHFQSNPTLTGMGLQSVWPLFPIILGFEFTRCILLSVLAFHVNCLTCHISLVTSLSYDLFDTSALFLPSYKSL